ncbi:unnamed protein product [Urochloa humidicola]
MKFVMPRAQCASLNQRCGRLRDAALCCALLHHRAEARRWVSATAAATLMVATGTSIRRSFLVPFFALQAPSRTISTIKGDYDRWMAFAGILLRLLHFIPGELELPLSTILLVMIAPYKFMDLRESQGGAILSATIAIYLTFQHFNGVGSLRNAFRRESIIATVSIIHMTFFLQFPGKCRS